MIAVLCKRFGGPTSALTACASTDTHNAIHHAALSLKVEQHEIMKGRQHVGLELGVAQVPQRAIFQLINGDAGKANKLG